MLLEGRNEKIMFATTKVKQCSCVIFLLILFIRFFFSVVFYTDNTSAITFCTPLAFIPIMFSTKSDKG